MPPQALAADRASSGCQLNGRKAPGRIEVESSDRHSAIVLGLKVGTRTLNGPG